MRLAELDPQWLRYKTVRGRALWHHVKTIELAQGVMFLCPVCFVTNHGPVGTHRVVCWSRSRGVPDEADPKPGRWTLVGSSYEDLTLNGDPPGNPRSVLLNGPGCGWHGFITNGEVS